MAKKTKKKKSSSSKSGVRRRAIKRKRKAPKRRSVVKRPKKKRGALKTKAAKRLPKLPAESIGRVTHYFSKAQAAAVMIERDGVRVGDTLFFKGHTTQFKQGVQSLQIDRRPVQQASVGEEVGIGVRSRVREHDLVFKL